MVSLTQLKPQQMDFILFNSSQRHICYQNITTIDGQVITAVELVFKAQYLLFMKENSNWYWKQQSLQHNIIVSTRTILHPSRYVVIMTDVQ